MGLFPSSFYPRSFQILDASCIKSQNAASNQNHCNLLFSPPARYEDLEQSDVRVQYLWEALTNFTNGEFTVYFAPF